MISLHTLKRRLTTCVIALICTIAAHDRAVAQYYSWGADPMNLTWSQITTNDVSLIYPDTVDYVARRTLHFINAVKGDIDYGYNYSALNIPFVMHPENLASNGLVMWMPKRIEFLTAPSIESFSMPWVKQLVAHEYRHAVQYNNLNQNVIKWLSYILGEQGSAVGLALLPLYIIEGDAVMCETQMSTYGRGVQPSFTMEYRALGREVLESRNFDRWVCGSYLSHTPDYYQMGYQMANYTYNLYEKNIWNDVVSYATRRPYTIATTYFALKNYYDTSITDIFHATFDGLNNMWDSLPARRNSTERVSGMDKNNYTTYSHPVWVDSRQSIIALKSDYASPSRFVEINTEGSERKISHTGTVSTRPTEGGDRLWWSEYRQSSFFDQKVDSKLCYMDLSDGRQHTVKGMGATLYPTAIGGSRNHIAYVEYAPSGVYSIVEIVLRDSIPERKSFLDIRSLADAKSFLWPNMLTADSFVELSRVAIETPIEIHGLAWDNATDELYFIATDDSGMWLGTRDAEHEKGYRALRKGAYISLSDLRAADGKLYFGSIESGYDELHSYDIASGKETRLTESKYGSFDPIAAPNGYIYGTTYDKYGYHVSRQKNIVTQGEVEQKQTPQNIVNPPSVEWNVINLDTINYTTIDSMASYGAHRSKKYKKGFNLINVHSWMPVVFDPIDASAEQLLDNTVGATAVSQNLLSTTEGFISAGYDFDEGFVTEGKLYYTGLGVKLGAQVNYGGYNIIYVPSGAALIDDKKYLSTTLSASLPILVREGYHKGQISLSTSWNFSNSYVTDLDNLIIDPHTGSISASYYQGLHKMAFGIGYTGWVSSAVRDANTPLLYSLSANYMLSPSDRNFSDLISLYGHITVPGLLPHNTVSLSMNYQESIKGYDQYGIEALMFRSVSLLPRGFELSDIYNDNYLAASLNYELPLIYPETGISSILYVRRVRANVGFDAAQFRDSSDQIYRLCSYGGDLIFDLNPLRLPSTGTTTLKLSLYQTNRSRTSFTVGLSLPL